jgi:hypothetical protein
MQSLKDAAVVLALLLLLVSVKVAPLEGTVDVIPTVEAAEKSEEPAGLVHTGLPTDALVPAMRLAPEVEVSTGEGGRAQIDTSHRCETSVLHVQTVELGEDGESIILRIDTGKATAGTGCGKKAEPHRPEEELQACKVG